MEQDLYTEVTQLRSCVNGLTRLTGIGTLVNGRSTIDAMCTLADLLSSMLPLDIVYARFGQGAEVARAGGASLLDLAATAMASKLQPALADGAPVSTCTIPSPMGAGTVTVLKTPLGTDCDCGVLLAASTRADFPTASEALMVRVGAGQLGLELLRVRGANGSHGVTDDRPKTLVESEREYILEALRRCNWVIGGRSGAAARLGLKRTSLQYKMTKLGIRRPGREDGASGQEGAASA